MVKNKIKTLEYFASKFGDMTYEQREVLFKFVGFIMALKEEGYKIDILSNAWEIQNDFERYVVLETDKDKVVFFKEFKISAKSANESIEINEANETDD